MMRLFEKKNCGREPIKDLLKKDIEQYIKYNYDGFEDESDDVENCTQFKLERLCPDKFEFPILCRREADELLRIEDEPQPPDLSKPSEQSEPPKESLSEMLSKLDDTFAVTLLKLIDAKDMTDVECYKKANVSKQTWYKIMNSKNYRPSKNTVLVFAIALELSVEETDRLLATVGFALSRSSKFDVIIEYFIENKIYDIDTINDALYEFDQVCLNV